MKKTNCKERTATKNKSYARYQIIMRKIADVHHALSLMHWDRETYIPKDGFKYRSQQIATLTGIAHDMFVSKELGDLLHELSNNQNLDNKSIRNIKETLRSYTKAIRYSTEFVMQLAEVTSEAFHTWNTARKENNFKFFKKPLEKIIALKREEAELLGYKDHPYDALLDDYEPHTTIKDIEPLFKQVKTQLVDFVQQIFDASPVDDSFLYQRYDKKAQWDLGIYFLKQMGYDFDAGRQDLSPHPFTTSFNTSDVRITTRINENDLKDMLFSCIHEGGHGLYEQGLNAKDYGLPSGEAISLGIHESQSRLWEKNIGFSHAYWEANYSYLQKVFPKQFKDINLDTYYKGINNIKPSLIRTSADELTYHLHVLIRYEIEKALIEDNLKVADLPEVWNSKYKKYLNIDVTSDKDGVLQDIHWAHGSIGYFPTYSLGSFYATQFFEQAKKDVPSLSQYIKGGDMQPLLQWLRENIHQHGKLYTARELCKKITGEELNFSYFMNYIQKKYGEIYNL